MAIKIEKATELAKTSGVKVLLYAASGVGKTTQFKHTGKTILISLESGELVLSDAENVDVVRAKNLAEIREAYEYVRDNISQYDTVGVDSLSELSEAIVAELKRMPEYSDAKDTFKLWGKYTEIITQIAKSFRDLDGINVVLVALEESVKSGFEEKIMPSIAAKKAQAKLPSLYDEVLYLRVSDDGTREFVCQPTAEIVAKDRSGKLNEVEPCSPEQGLEYIFKKIKGK